MRYGLIITKKLAKAKMENLVVKLNLGNGKVLTCKVVKLLGTEVEVMVNKVDKRKIVVNTLIGVEFVDEHIKELA